MNQQIVEKIDYLFPSFIQTDMVCILCDGSHGNNSLCQIELPSEGEAYDIC